MFSCRFGCSITHNLFLFNVLAGPLVTEKDLNVGHTEASETLVCAESELYIMIGIQIMFYIYIYTFLIVFR